MSGNAYQILCLACGEIYNADCGHKCKNPYGHVGYDQRVTSVTAVAENAALRERAEKAEAERDAARTQAKLLAADLIDMEAALAESKLREVRVNWAKSI